MTIFRGKRRKQWRLARQRKCRQNNTSHMISQTYENESKKHLETNLRSTTPAKQNKRKRIQGSSCKKQNKYSRLKTLFSPIKHSTPKKTSKRTLHFSLESHSISETENEEQDTFLYSLNDVFTDSDVTDFEEPISLYSEHEAEDIERDKPYDAFNDEKTMNALFNEVLLILKRQGKRDELVTFLKLVAQGRFPLDNVAFMLFLDVIKWFNSDDVRQIRYNDTTLKFFWLGKKLFGGRFLRFMSGPKNEADGVLQKTNFTPMDSKINFACPSESRLSNYNPLGYDVDVEAGPGIVKSMIDIAAKHDINEKSYIIMFDGKKIKRGADMDLLGFEKEPVSKKKEKLRKDLDILDETFDLLQVIDNSKKCESHANLCEKIRACFQVISKYLMQMRKLKQTKVLTLKKHKERIQKDASLAKSLQYALDACKTASYQIDNCIEVFLNVQWELCKAGAYLNGTLHLFAKSKNVSVENQPNVKLLNDVAEVKLMLNKDELPTHLIKQRSEEWFAARENVKVTGSSIYTAVGCDGLKRQNEHFDNVFSNVTKPKPDESQRKAMEHGVQSESHQIATLSSVIIPFLFPNMVYIEEGYYLVDGVIVSPDGSLRDTSGSLVTYAFEGKAPMPKEYTTRQHYTVPSRYITQTIYEQKATDSENGTLYMCWTPESTTLFTVAKNDKLYDMIQSVIERIYGEDIPRRRTRLINETKELKEKLQEFAEECEFIGEFPSVKADSTVTGSKEPEDDNETFNYSCLSRSLLKAKESVKDAFNLQRNYASQVVVYLLADLDRLWKSELPHAIPVMYCYRGYSLAMDQARELLDLCRNTCKKEGLDVIATASDGEFKQLMVIGKNETPLTLYQLSKMVWHEVCKIKKTRLINILSSLNRKYTVKNEGKSRISLTSSDGGSNITTSPNGWKKKNKSKRESPLKPLIEQYASDVVIETQEDVHHIPGEFDTSMNMTDLHIDADQTISYDFEELLQEQMNYESDEAFPRKLNNDEKKDILYIIHQRRPQKWKDTSFDELTDILENKLKILIVDELLDISKYLNLKLRGTKFQLKVRRMKKNDLVEQLRETIQSHGNEQPLVQGEPVTRRKSKVRQPETLHALATATLRNQSYPKQALNIAYASYIWPHRVEQWLHNSKVSNIVSVQGNSEELSFKPYYVPEFDEKEEDFKVFIYDRTHLGTNLRKCLCLDKVDGISIRAWKVIAERNPNILHPTIVGVSEDGKILDQMKEKLARAMVTEAVEQEMVTLGYTKEANFCNVIREGLFVADDVPGIDAMERCKKRLQLIKWLDNDVDFGKFPPYGGRIKGLSHILYEGIRTSQEGKLYLYALAKAGRYCVRAANTLCSESFFGSMQEMDPWGQGILSSKGVQKHISDFTTITALKMETNRNVFIKTKKDTVYPSANVYCPDDKETDIEDDKPTIECNCRKDKFIRCIIPRNHFFDTRERARVYKGEKLYKPGTEELKGEQPIRAQYGYKINEAKMLPSQRLGISSSIYHDAH